MFSPLPGATCDICDCPSARSTQGLYGQIREHDVFQRWNKQRYIMLGHRNNTKELQVPKDILEGLPPILNVAWFLNHPP